MDDGREMDALVAENVMGDARCDRHGTYGECFHGRFGLDYSTDIEAAWLVYLKVTDGLFSQRTRFYAALQEQARERVGVTVQWPDVLTVLRHEMPLAICRAALAATIHREVRG